MRADARRNREAISAAALDLFTERGVNTSMEDIARAAGLGVGTLYRHFPDRRALLEDIAVEGLRGYLEFAREAARRSEPRWRTLLGVVEYSVGLPLALIKSMSDAPSAGGERLSLQREVNAVLEELIAGAQAEGALRRDIPPAEVVGLLNVAVCRPGARADDHLTTVIIDGLRARG